MSTRQEDWLLRMISLAMEAVRRLREQLAGGAAAGEVVEAAQQAQGELLGTRHTMLQLLDPRSAADLLGDRRQVELWADLLDVEAEALRRAGDHDAAAQRAQRARQLRAQATTER